ncbi:MAG: DUF222 domain-containing protein [Actinobacteria bacterium]|nr:DUF222 domain-containing protein [Actinomycetota bacterium]
MDVGVLRPLIAAGGLSDAAACRAELVAIGVVRGLLDAREVEVVARLDVLAEADHALFAQGVIADAARVTLGHAERLRDRATVCAAIPELAGALSAGATTGDRVDIVARAANGLNTSERALLAGHGQQLARAAGEQTASGFRKTVEHVVRRLRADDGLARLEQQRRMARLRWFTDGDGMWCLNGRFDPASGARLEGRLRNLTDQQFSKATPAHCPSDPIDKQQHLAALALTNLLLGDDTATSTGSGAPDVTVIIDAETFLTGHPHQGTVCDIGLGHYGLPTETIRRWACIGTLTPVVVAADGVRIMLGRETRLANRAQRRALRVLYRSCALCDIPFDHCQIHHINWYTLGGLTDIDALIPICNRHHHLVHEGGWQLHLAPNRTLTTTLPDQTTMTHAPPNAHAA